MFWHILQLHTVPHLITSCPTDQEHIVNWIFYSEKSDILTTINSLKLRVILRPFMCESFQSQEKSSEGQEELFAKIFPQN